MIPKSACLSNSQLGGPKISGFFHGWCLNVLYLLPWNKTVLLLLQNIVSRSTCCVCLFLLTYDFSQRCHCEDTFILVFFLNLFSDWILDWILPHWNIWYFDASVCYIQWPMNYMVFQLSWWYRDWFSGLSQWRSGTISFTQVAVSASHSFLTCILWEVFFET